MALLTATLGHVDLPTSPGRHSGNAVHALTELAPDFVTVVDAAGLISYVSPAIERVMGYRPGEIIGRRFLEFVHVEDQQTGREDLGRLITRHEFFAPRHLRFRQRDGSYRTLEMLMKHYHGTLDVRGVLVSARDPSNPTELEDALRSAEAEVSDLYQNAPCGYHSLDQEGVVVRINDTELRWLGRARDEVVGKMHFKELLSAASIRIFERCLPVFTAQGMIELELELLCKDGGKLPVLLSATAVADEHGRFGMGRCTLHDLSERRVAESALRKVNRALLTLSAVNMELVNCEEELALLQTICRVCVEVCGYRLAWVGFALQDEAQTVSPVAAFGFEEGYLSHADISWGDNAKGLGPSGTAIRTDTVQVNQDFLADPRMTPWRDEALRCGYRSSIALPLNDTSGAFGGLMIYAAEPDAFDAAEVRLLEEVAADLAFGILTLRARARHKSAEEQVKLLAYFDPLTGLPNRNHLLDETGQVSERQKSGGPQFALLSLIVVLFSDIQSGIGMRKADDVLRQLAVRLQEALQEGELLARTGGDEFAVLLREGDVNLARACGARIEQALIQPFQQAGISITVLVRIGAAISAGDVVAEDAETLLMRSGIAAREARRKGDSFALFEGTKEVESPRHLILVSELRAAIEARQLILHYQPRIDLSNGKIAGVEALVRWRHSVRGLIPPGEFISIAERTGLIRPLTYLVLDAALRQCNSWSAQGFDMPVAVNVSSNNFNDPDFVGRIDQMLQTWNVKPEFLQLEITESVMMEEPAQTLDILVRLKERGILVSIDDFGTGYSSLSYVATLPIEALKIDRSFVIQMVDSERTRNVVAATIALAQSLGIKTVAEGVEAKDQAELLMAMGCNEIQGFYFCRPVEAEELSRWSAGFTLEAYGIALPTH